MIYNCVKHGYSQLYTLKVELLVLVDVVSQVERSKHGKTDRNGLDTGLDDSGNGGSQKNGGSANGGLNAPVGVLLEKEGSGQVHAGDSKTSVEGGLRALFARLI